MELFLFGNGLESVAGLMEAGIAGVTVKYWIFIVTFSTEADLTVCFKKTFHFLKAGVALGFVLLLHADFLYHGYLQCIL